MSVATESNHTNCNIMRNKMLKMKHRWLLREEKWHIFVNKEKSDEDVCLLGRSRGLPENLHLQSVSDTSDSDADYTVISSTSLQCGDSLGCFKVRNQKDEEDNLKFICERTGESVILAPDGSESQWLLWLSTTEDIISANIKVSLRDTQVHCDVIKNIALDTELCALFQVEENDERKITTENLLGQPSSHHNHTEKLKRDDGYARKDISRSGENNDIFLKAEKMEFKESEVPRSPDRTPTMHNTSSEIEMRDQGQKLGKSTTTDDSLMAANDDSTTPPRFPLIYACVNCGVRFSSSATLGAHLTFYCSKRFSAGMDTECSKGFTTDERDVRDRTDSSVSQNSSASLHSSPLPRVKRSHSDDDMQRVSPKMPRMDSSYHCPHCSFSTDKHVNLTEHIATHISEQEPASKCGNDSEEGDHPELYCHDCKIQFSSVKTYSGHKEFYCSNRQKKLQSKASTVSTPSKSPRRENRSRSPGHAEAAQASSLSPQAAYAAALQRMYPSSPPGMVTPHGIVPPQASVMVAAPVMTPAGMTNMTFNVPAMFMQPVIDMTLRAQQEAAIAAAVSEAVASRPEEARKKPASNPVSPPMPSTPPKTQNEIPLDLTVRKTSPTPRIQSDSSNSQSPREMQRSDVASSKGSPSSVLSSGSAQDGPDPHMNGDIMSMNPFLLQQPAAAAAAAANPAISRCHDCNIVFYKYENYVIHKEHYCAGRRRAKPSETVARSKSPATSPPQLNHSMESLLAGHQLMLSQMKHLPGLPTVTGQRKSAKSPEILPPNMENAFLQFYCIPCKIKFSSADTLKAHQEFYCPHKEGLSASLAKSSTDETSSAAISPVSSAPSEELEGGTHVCHRCNNSYPSLRLLKHHFCKVYPSALAPQLQVPVLRCPYCEYLTQSETRLFDHIKGHAPTRAYKCRLCGYRGNTRRGMRMHGKTHLDNGEEFNEEDMLEIEEPPLIPKRLKTVLPETLTLNNENELIRLKNEPYKRRRSRKAYEKVDLPMTSPVKEDESLIPNPLLHEMAQVCIICQQTFTDPEKMQEHAMRHMEEAALTCRLCRYLAPSSDQLVEHMRDKHDIALENCLTNDSANSRIDANSQNTSPQEPHSIKVESPDDVDDDSKLSQHGKSETLEDGGDQLVSKQVNGIVHKTPVKEEVEKDLDESKLREKSKSPYLNEDNLAKENFIAEIEPKEELKGTADVNSNNELVLNRIDSLSNGSNSPLCAVNGNSDGKHTARDKITSSITDLKNDKNSPRYCKQCDITFMYFNTFMAHKKYYCSSHSGEKLTAHTEA